MLDYMIYITNTNISPLKLPFFALNTIAVPIIARKLHIKTVKNVFGSKV